MSQPQMDPRLDGLAVLVQDWTDSAVALEDGHFPNEMLRDLDDLIEEVKDCLEEAGAAYDGHEVATVFATPEMAEVIDRFTRVRRRLEQTWGPELVELIEEGRSDFDGSPEEDE